jgi:hypothetical protein
MASRVGVHMKELGIKFVEGFSPENIEFDSEGDGRRLVRWGGNKSEKYDTVLYAIGRSA